MGTEERKKRERQHRRNVIIDAAEKVIFSKGIEQATMKKIAEEAELSKGTLYLYFKNKTELYMAIAKRGSDYLNSQFSKLFAGDHTGFELIRMLGETYLTFVRENPDYFHAFQHYELIGDVEELQQSDVAKACEKNRREALNYMVRALQIGMQDGTIDDSYDPRMLSIMLWSSTRGITTMSHMKEIGHYFEVLDDMEVKTENLFDGFLKLIGTGIATEEARKKWMTGGHKSETSSNS